jgi:triacylglycerol lipase
MADRVLTLTTIGTPHRGSSFADWGIRRLERLLKPILDICGIPRQAFYDLTTVRCRTFNEEVPDAPGVRYFSVAGQFEPDWLTPEWQLPYWIINQTEGSNDGLVSVASASYGESCEVWAGDHASLINWPNPMAQARGRWRDRAPNYAGLVRRLADEGF